MKLLIFGVGGMGKFFKDFFKVRGYYVRGYDIVESRRDVELEDISKFDVIFVCVPMENIKSALEDIKKFANPRTLIVDISTIKSDILPLFDESGFDYMSIHPMFGPKSDIGLSNIIVVHRSGREEENFILEEFKKAGAIIGYLSRDEHDKIMAEIQGLSHFMLLALADYLREKVKDYLNYASPIFCVLYKLASRIISQNWKMYLKIQKNAQTARDNFLNYLIEFNERLKRDDEFEKIFRDLRSFYVDKGESTIILDSYKATLDVKSLDLLRGYIRALDSLILRLIERRVESGRSIAKIKKDKEEPIEITDIEEIKIRDLIEKTNLNPVLIHKVFKNIITLTKEEEYKILNLGKKIAILGPMGSFSEEMALKLIGSRLPLIYCKTINEIIKSVEKGKTEYGLLPIENSINGTVLPVLDALLNSNVEVFGECELDVIHCLTAKREIPLKNIKIIYSHPQAIAQCINFISNYLPHVEIRYTTSTSDAIEMLDENSAAITSEYAARLYRLCILRKGIQDVKDNVTRFYLIRKKGGKRNGRITAMFFGVEDRVGALKDVLEVFYEKGINMRKLESRPAKTGLGDYIFFVELEKALNDDDLKDLRKVTTFYKIIGIFDRVDHLDLS